MTNFLGGLFAAPQPTTISGLLNPANSRRAMFSNALMQAGLGLLNPDPRAPNAWRSGIGNALAGAQQGMQQGREDYIKNGLVDIQLQDMQRQRDQQDQHQKYLDDLIKVLPPDQQSWARAFPDKFAETVLRAKYDTSSANPYGANYLLTQDNQNNYHVLLPNRAKGTLDEAPLPNGQRYAPNMHYYDTGTDFTGRPTKGIPGPDSTPANIPINNAGAAEQKQVGQDTADLRKSLPKVRANMKLLDGQWDLVDQSIDDAMQMIDSGVFPRTGMVGALGSGIPGTPQYDLSQKLDTIKANIGFDKLQAMREASPTGGALGNVSDFENKLLQAVQGSMQQGQSADQLKQNLTVIKQLVDLLRQEKHQAFMETYNGLSPTVGGAPQPGAGSPAADPLGIR